MKSTHAQATITGLVQSTSFGREKGLEERESFHNVKVFGKNALHSPTKLIPVCGKFA